MQLSPEYKKVKGQQKNTTKNSASVSAYELTDTCFGCIVYLLLHCVFTFISLLLFV